MLQSLQRRALAATVCGPVKTHRQSLDETP